MNWVYNINHEGFYMETPKNEQNQIVQTTAKKKSIYIYMGDPNAIIYFNQKC